MAKTKDVFGFDELEKAFRRMKKKYPDKNEIEFQNQIKENFPFLQLMLIINRDIQFISSQIENKNAKNLKRIKNDLIYPVEYRTDNFETKKMWYLEYEKRVRNEKDKT